MEEKQSVGVIWVRLNEGESDITLNKITDDFLKKNKHIIDGAKFHELASRDQGLKLINRLEKVMGLGKYLKTQQKQGLLYNSNGDLK